MSSQDQSTVDEINKQRDAFRGSFLQSLSGGFDVFSIYIGHRLNLYRELVNGQALTSAELAARTGTNERYIREWLEQQAVTGILSVENANADIAARKFT